mmetsp:Transcript_7086/g.17017  ORF Transcript_7086/g.17017 Transcript_7086/m.17017 type:complete len:246 (-) Transcript_7086:276-1013(-)
MCCPAECQCGPAQQLACHSSPPICLCCAASGLSLAWVRLSPPPPSWTSSPALCHPRSAPALFPLPSQGCTWAPSVACCCRPPSSAPQAGPPCSTCWAWEVPYGRFGSCGWYRAWSRAILKPLPSCCLRVRVTSAAASSPCPSWAVAAAVCGRCSSSNSSSLKKVARSHRMQGCQDVQLARKKERRTGVGADLRFLGWRQSSDVHRMGYDVMQLGGMKAWFYLGSNAFKCRDTEKPFEIGFCPRPV